MWNPADAIDPRSDGVFEKAFVGGIGVDPVLREGGHLNRGQISRLLAQAQQARERRPVLGGHIGVRANKERSLRHRPPDHLGCSRHDVLRRERFLQLSPDRDSFEQGAGSIETWPSGGEHGIEVKVAVDERRSGQATAGVQLPAADECRVLLDGHPPTVAGGEVDCAQTGDRCSPDDEITRWRADPGAHRPSAPVDPETTTGSWPANKVTRSTTASPGAWLEAACSLKPSTECS